MIFDSDLEWVELQSKLYITIHSGDLPEVEIGPPQKEYWLQINIRNPMNGREVQISYVGPRQPLPELWLVLFYRDVVQFYLNTRAQPLGELRLSEPEFVIRLRYPQTKARWN